jgi:glycosyltransferase involved in cell wall biosynthesis
VSVIIPTYNRSKLLPKTVDSFLAQTYPANRYEIIMANNNSTDDTQMIINEYCSRHAIIKAITENRQGVHYARNSAAKIAKGEILYFTDDDMIADRDLLENLVKVFSMDYNVATATGKILPEWESKPPKWVLKYCYNGLLSLNDRREQLIIAPFNIGVYSCHQAILREAFFKSGGFNPENTAGEWLGDGEDGMNRKLMELGYGFAYCGESVIHHMIPSSRMTQGYLNKRLANQGNCDSYTEYRAFRYNALQLMFQMTKRVLNSCSLLVKFFPRFILGRDSWRLLLARLFYNLNRIKYDLRLLYDEKWRSLVLKCNWLDEQ